MAVSGTVSATNFNTNRVIDNAFRRCRLDAQAITPEMQSYARDALYLLLSDIANVKTPSWCQERQIYPLYQGQPVVTMDTGTVGVLNVNLRILQEVTGTVVTATNSVTYDFTGNEGGVSVVNTLGLKWAAAAAALTVQTSDDNTTWTTVATVAAGAAAGEWSWTDIVPASAAAYFRITSVDPIDLTQIYLGNNPQEIPLGELNRDTYAAQTNKVFEGRPLTYWFQRDRVQPVMRVWPAPDAAAETKQLIVWRHRHIMDVGPQGGDIEVPQRWMEAIVAMLAAKLAQETPAVDINLIPMLDTKANNAYTIALAGDNSGAPTFIQPVISFYTR